MSEEKRIYVVVAEQVRGAEYFDPVTTIILSARNDMELRLLSCLMTNAEVPYEYFLDTNPEAYYGSGPVLTAICTHPINPAAVDGILDHLPLWAPKCG